MKNILIIDINASFVFFNCHSEFIECYYFLFTFLLAASAAPTNVLWSLPFLCSLNSPTTGMLSSSIWSMVSWGY